MTENARTKLKMQEQKGKCKDDIKSYFLDRLEQVERDQKLLYIQKGRQICICNFEPFGQSGQ